MLSFVFSILLFCVWSITKREIFLIKNIKKQYLADSPELFPDGLPSAVVVNTTNPEGDAPSAHSHSQQRLRKPPSPAQHHPHQRMLRGHRGASFQTGGGTLERFPKWNKVLSPLWTCGRREGHRKTELREICVYSFFEDSSFLTTGILEGKERKLYLS